MLKITIPGQEFWNEATQEFTYTEGTTLLLEHSLVSLSKWESKWHKPFLGREDKTLEETLDYIRCMTLNEVKDQGVYNFIPRTEMEKISAYIQDTMTATTINERRREGEAPNSQVITSELIYYWMIALNIPVEFENWHLNRLLMLIKVVNIKNQPNGKMSQKETLARYRDIKARSRAKKGT